MNLHQKFRTVAAGIALALCAPLTALAQTVQVAEGLTVETFPKVTGTFQFAHGFGLIYGPMPVARQLGIVGDLLYYLQHLVLVHERNEII